MFARGIAEIYDWFDYLKTTHRLGHDELTQCTYGSGPQDRPESFRIRYGLGVLRKLPRTMPVLILQGAQDTTLPPAQAEALAEELKVQRQSYTLRVYAHSGHGFVKPCGSRGRTRRCTRNHCKPGPRCSAF